MAYFHSPRLITDGLVLYLDAANTKSYPGSGTIWNDLSGNGNNGTLVNGPTFDSDNLGSLVFNGTTQYISGGSALQHMIDAGSHTHAYWIKTRDAFKGILMHGIRTSSFQRRFGHYVDASGFVAVNQTGTDEWPNLFETSTTPINDGNWHHVSSVYDSGTETLKVYVDGVEESGGQSQSITSVYFSVESIIEIGRGRSCNIDNLGCTSYADTYINALISKVLFYNRALTPEEILQNYNATKGRYGL